MALIEANERPKRGGPSFLIIAAVLTTLKDKPLSKTDVCKSVGFSYAHGPRIFGFLVAHGIVKISKGVNEDGRSCQVSLTQKGVALVNAINMEVGVYESV